MVNLQLCKITKIQFFRAGLEFSWLFTERYGQNVLVAKDETKTKNVLTLYRGWMSVLLLI